jgi:RNA-directed DNA polymerase
MNNPEESDSVIVATKPTNKTGQPAAEPVERRTEAEENTNRQSTCRAQNRGCVSQAQGRVRKKAKPRRQNPRWEPCAGIPLARICAGGAQ